MRLHTAAAMATKVETKLGKSLDAIIEENRKKLSIKKDKPATKPKGVRVDGGARRTRGIVAAVKRQHMEEDVPMRAPRGPRGGAGLGVQHGGIAKPRRGAGGNAASAFMHDDRTGGPAIGGGDDDYGFGGGRGARPAPRRAGNVEGAWAHDLYDDREQRAAAPVRRNVAPAAAVSSNRLEVENLAWKVTDQDLLELFQAVGPVTEAKVTYNRDGRSTGRGFVIFRRAGDVTKAITEYNGVALDGRDLVLTPHTGPVGAGHGGTVLSSGLTVTRTGGAPARAAVQARLGAGGVGERQAGSGGRVFQQSLPRAAPGGRGSARGGRGGGRLRSGVVGRSRADLDAEMDNFMQE